MQVAYLGGRGWPKEATSYQPLARQDRYQFRCPVIWRHLDRRPYRHFGICPQPLGAGQFLWGPPFAAKSLYEILVIVTRWVVLVVKVYFTALLAAGQTSGDLMQCKFGLLENCHGGALGVLQHGWSRPTSFLCRERCSAHCW